MRSNRLLSAVDAASYRCFANRVIAHTSAMTREFIAKGVPPQDIATIPLPIEFDRWEPSASLRTAVRAQLGIGDEPLLGMVGRLFWIKDQALLINSFAALQKEFPSVRLAIVGSGRDRDALVALVRELGISDKVLFQEFRSDIAGLMSALDALVHSARSESFGLTIVEAMAMAKPVLTTAVGIAPEVIVDGTSGFLVAPPYSENLTDGLRRLLIRRNDWRRIGQAGRDAVQHLKATAVVSQYEAQYLRWLDKRPAGLRFE